MRFPTVLSGDKHRRVRKLQLLGDELVRLTFASPSIGLYSRVQVSTSIEKAERHEASGVFESENAGRNRNP